MFGFLKKGKQHFAHVCTISGSNLYGEGALMSLLYSDTDIDPKKNNLYSDIYTIPKTIQSKRVFGLEPRHLLTSGSYYFDENVVFIPLDDLATSENKGRRKEDLVRFMPSFSDRARRKWKIALFKSTANSIKVYPGNYTLTKTNKKLYDLNISSCEMSEIIAELIILDSVTINDKEEIKFGYYDYKFCLVPDDTNGFSIDIQQMNIIRGV